MKQLSNIEEKKSALANLLTYIDNIKKTNISKSLLNEMIIDNKNILKEIDNINKLIKKTNY